MITTKLSLRARLTLIILVPLLLISLIVGLWAVTDAQARAAERFDRSLLSTTLAISRDTALSGGDALSEATRDLLSDTSGGQVFYHVYAPDGVFVTGYATPPVPPSVRTQPQLYYDGVHQGRSVRALRFTDAMTIDELKGDFVFTVWQDVALRDSFVRDLSTRTFTVIASLLAALSLIVWFGVRLGLRPLLDLQSAIGERSPNELAPIKRPIPIEVHGTVGTLNDLLEQLRGAIQTKDDFIANAAHQLRNPIAGVLAMSGAIRSAKTLADAQERSIELSHAAQEASDLANALLALERAQSPLNWKNLETIDLNALCHSVHLQSEPNLRSINIDLTTHITAKPVTIKGDRVLVEQAILNLIDNAKVHGGPNLTQISLRLNVDKDTAKIEIKDDGRGMSITDTEKAMERFGQLQPSSGSGIGLSFVSAVAQGLDGNFELLPQNPGLSAQLQLKI